MLARLIGVTKRYGKTEGVHDLSLELYPGQAVGLLGLNGSGKTTTLKLLAGMLFPTQGRVEVLGKSPRENRGQIAYLSDADNLYAWMTPGDAERFMRGLYPDFNPRRYRELLAFLEVPQQSYRAMSRGQRARLRLAMVLARDARLFLLDEPLSGIDVISRDRILKSLVLEWREEACLVLSTHEVSEAEGIFERVLLLKEGRLALDALAEDLRARGQSVKDAFIEVLA
ncbi:MULTISPECIES: ABC transporter ATP-binding protein [Meiothermus]|jgi:ABC-2 type transport system ATP-binding protein|uniref:ABC transporter n=2 Tax=Meiothermus TaxID=65551 RepID=D3PKN3_MEIRD|nr:MULTISPECIES: ABC transporter ATP-binding protein [Meiothermus]ADD28907.1 ABC transporter related protein [Meiothermus ruber DSM 1279]AGK05644.1 ABC transporter [Meiothermus ruber DSM 1279]AWR86086.1 ABC transporter related protein [Meiothermus taiwanensis WR-220]MCL6530881.1 ABC transporter ATP-binding protein [Meiothermus ruber]MCX7802665.1 ABC transporter ATP-binding protein [Meiothermus ruber]